MARPCHVLLTLAGLSLAPPGGGAAMAAGCDDLLPPALPAAALRAITARDLATLRDIGSVDPGPGGGSPLALSPDGRSVAFLLSRADPDGNRHCRAMAVLPLAGGGRPRLVDAGGDFLSLKGPSRGLVVENGVAAPVVPRWSPDGRMLAYLRRDGDAPAQLWVAAADGGGARAVTGGTVAVERFAWAADGAALVVGRRSGVAAIREARHREGLSGYLYDERFVPLRGAAPGLPWGLPLDYRRLDLASGRLGPASGADIFRVDPARAPGYPKGALAVAEAGGRRAALIDAMPGRLFGPVTLVADDAAGRPRRCAAASCTGEDFLGLWWTHDRRAVVYLRREGRAGSEYALYRWTPGAGAPRPITRGPDPLSGCQLGRLGLVCIAEASLQPRRIVLIDPRSGRRRTIFDPNPQWAQFRLGSVRRLFWRNDFGFDAFGDLVLPPGYRPGSAKLPLIVVQYESRGFLRGGTGDEVPILPLAARGYAVFSVQMPRPYSSSFPPGTWRDWDDAERANVAGWKQRRSVAGSVVSGLEQVAALGIVDPARIGLTGLSDGSTTAWWLLINTELFAATSVGSCCADPATDAILVGPAWEKLREQWGYPSPVADRPDFWRPASPARNAARIRTPVLMQLADSEYLRALEAYAAFRRIGPPAEMIVFPGEHHVKHQPAHRLAIYERNMDWFDYWLRHIEDPDPAKQEQYRRWSALAARALARHWRPPGSDDQPQDSTPTAASGREEDAARGGAD